MCVNDTVPEGVALIPLYAREGTVRAYTLVDSDDAAFLNQWRWFLVPDGYATRTEMIEGCPTSIRMHRVLLGLDLGDKRIGDHINRVRIDNRRSNLRVVDKVANNQNRGATWGSASGYRGVHLHKPGIWRAKVRHNGKDVHLGLFTSVEEAAEAVSIGRQRLMTGAID